MQATAHPALIPQEAPGSSRTLPRIPAARGKGLLTAGIPAYPRSARKRHDRPVTPEVAGSSPVAPVKVLQIDTCRVSLDAVSPLWPNPVAQTSGPKDL